MKSTLIDYYTEKGLHRIELQTYLHFGVRDIILHERERLSRYWPIVILSRLHRDAICALALALGIIFISAYMRVSNLETILILKAPSIKCVKIHFGGPHFVFNRRGIYVATAVSRQGS